MAHPRWAEGLSVAGLYYDGVVDECKLQEILELHKRDTVSTFGTRSSCRVAKMRAPATPARGHPKQGRGGAWNVMDAREKSLDHAQTARI